MRGVRWVLLLAIVAILGRVGFVYKEQKDRVQRDAPQKPEPLPQNTQGQMREWEWTSTVQGRPVVHIRARNFRQDKAGHFELEGVRIKITQKGGAQYDLVESQHAIFRPSDDQLYAEGDVFITRGVPEQGQPKRQLVTIRTSAVTFNRQTGKASTDRPADFTFENGAGKAVGAYYDPEAKELVMTSAVELNWRGKDAKSKPLRLEAGLLVYKERESLVRLTPWAKLHRDTATLEGGETVVTLRDGIIQTIESQQASGVDTQPKRQLNYSADLLRVEFADGAVRKVIGQHNARLVSTAATGVTTMTGDHMDLDFTSENGDAILQRAQANGRGFVESKPVAGATPALDTRTVRSEVIDLKMREGGAEIATVETHTPGTIEFLPNQPGRRRRRIEGERFWITYGARNAIETFRAVKVETRSESPLPKNPPAETRSQNLLAHFDPKTGQMSRLEQWEDFRYDEGPRHATAAKAVLEQNEDRMTLEGVARVWDPAGSTAADTIRMRQSTGDFTAEGRVTSSRKADPKDPSMLSGAEPVQATAARMTSVNGNSVIKYEGGAVIWQGASRLKADIVEIDRDEQRVVAQRNVETQLPERSNGQVKGAAPPILTIVRSAGLVYTEPDRLAHYTGGVLLTRPRMRVKSLELRAWLAEAGEESSLEKAIADGRVEIFQTSPGRTRTGSSEHAEYFVPEEKILMRGGNPQLSDSHTGTTRGSELTWFAADDRLIVNGVPERPATSRLRRK
ncbi:MAG: LPS export ABC transporter periplasmic protein LptC [Bryobacteraceae bacterium]